MNVSVMPYTTEFRLFGPTGSQVAREVKVYRNGMAGDLLTDDEKAVARHVEFLSGKVDELERELASMKAASANAVATVAQPAPPAGVSLPSAKPAKAK